MQPLPLPAALATTLAVVAMAAGGCAAPTPPARQPPAVQVEPIGEAMFSPAIEMVSQLSTTTDVALRPQVEGRVVQILGQQGQQVEAGQPILVLDTRSSGLPSMRPAPRRAGTR